MTFHVRTTLTLEDDLAGLLKQRARELGIPFKEAVNLTIRAGLGKEAAAMRRGQPSKTIPHSFGIRPGIDPDTLGQLADELEAEASPRSRMILPDVNVLIHAHNADSPVHDADTRNGLQQLAPNKTPISLLTTLARVITNHTSFHASKATIRRANFDPSPPTPSRKGRGSLVGSGLAPTGTMAERGDSE